MGSHWGGTDERPALFFDTAADFDAWLAEHHASETVLWMGMTKKHVGRGLTWADAVPVALRWGWIDSTSQRLDDDSTRQRWSPRKKGSTWSRVNIAHVERMIAEGVMQPSGLAAYHEFLQRIGGLGAQPPAGGTRGWNPREYAYEMGEAGLYPEHEARLRTDAAASAFWDAATASYRKICAAWIAQAKTDATRERRIAQLLDDSANGRLIPPQRYGDVPGWLTRAAAAAASVG